MQIYLQILVLIILTIIMFLLRYYARVIRHSKSQLNALKEDNRRYTLSGIGHISDSIDSLENITEILIKNEVVDRKLVLLMLKDAQDNIFTIGKKLFNLDPKVILTFEDIEAKDTKQIKAWLSEMTEEEEEYLKGWHSKEHCRIPIEVLKRIIFHIFDISEQFQSVMNLNHSTGLVSDLNIDSLQAVEIVMTIEELMEIKIPDQHSEHLFTLGDWINYLERRVEYGC